MNKIKEKIARFYNSLTIKQKLIYATVLVVIATIIYLIFVNNSYRNTDINYNKIDTAKIIESSNVLYDRATIASLDDILKNLLRIKFKNYYIENEEVTLKKVYSNLVTTNYKKKMSYGKFKKTMENLYTNIIANDDINLMLSKEYIKKVYYSNEYDIYLLELKSQQNEVKNYIGIRLLNNDTEFAITYLE